MERNTKERILTEALRLFAQSGYSGTSMSSIAEQLGITKAALYKHFLSKQEILDSIVERMSRMDAEYARRFEMPEGTVEAEASAYNAVSAENLLMYTRAMFLYWTQEEFPCHFRRMLTLEQYRDTEMAKLYCQYLSSGPLGYVIDVLRAMTASEATARQLALELYGPMFMLYSVYDHASRKSKAVDMLDAHLAGFSARLEAATKGDKND